MHKLYNKTQDKFIVYDNYRIINTNIPSVIFLHGLMSSMQSTKAIYLIDYCKKTIIILLFLIISAMETHQDNLRIKQLVIG